MNENTIQSQEAITLKSKLINFFNKNKILFYSILSILTIIIIVIFLYISIKEKREKLLVESYIEAKIFIEHNQREKAKEVLKTIIESKHKTYSPLSFFLLLSEDLITDDAELSIFFNNLLENNKIDKEIKNLIIFKQALFHSNFSNESELLKIINPLLNKETIWKPHALLLMGDYFASKKEYSKAKEFYTQIFSIKNLNIDFYKKARSQLAIVSNE